MTQCEIKISGQVELYKNTDMLPDAFDINLESGHVFKLYFTHKNTTIEGVNETVYVVNSAGVSISTYGWTWSGSELSNIKHSVCGKYACRLYTTTYARYFLEK